MHFLKRLNPSQGFNQYIYQCVLAVVIILCSAKLILIHFLYFPGNVMSDIGPNQQVSHYEIAIGTDRRYPSTRNNIHPFINAGLNKTWTFHHLDLIPKTSYYYITVRAYSLATTMVEITSNGIRVGYGGHIVSLGEIRSNE